MADKGPDSALEEEAEPLGVGLVPEVDSIPGEQAHKLDVYVREV